MQCTGLSLFPMRARMRAMRARINQCCMRVISQCSYNSILLRADMRKSHISKYCATTSLLLTDKSINTPGRSCVTLAKYEHPSDRRNDMFSKFASRSRKTELARAVPVNCVFGMGAILGILRSNSLTFLEISAMTTIP